MSDEQEQIPRRQIRAAYDAETITVYQAYGPQIGVPAARDGRFGSAFKRERMTWIKPSFLWMMYRCGWAAKPGQEHVLALRISRAGFEWALAHSAFAHYDSDLHADQATWRQSLTAPVRVQWDPERDAHFRPLPHRAIQIGLSGEAVHRYCDEWIVGITEVTDLARECHAALREGGAAAVAKLLPEEREYVVPADIAARIAISKPTSAPS